ncbi:extracellular solute-binding protein [Microbacterium sp. DT81.1]|uniref:extracellular solute-binding protein n=1 Tax=Microbacterium sp. DT81.1 TaxID=3393413 RepID=UPI003CEEE86E
MTSDQLPGRGVSRRGFLTGAAVLGLTFGSGILASCAPGTIGGTAAAAGSGVALPAFARPEGIKPDLPGSADGVQPGYFSYPKKLVKTVKEAPGTGVALTSMIMTFAAAPAQSQYFDAVNKALNAPIDLVMVPAADYTQRFSTVIAGGDLPDTMEIVGYLALPRIGDFLKAKCVDLSKHLSGDAVKKYPNLAAIPTQSWNSTRVNGKIYGVPIPRNIFYPAPFYRKDIVDASGADLPGTPDEFVAFCKDFTSKQNGVYALASGDPANPFGTDFYRGIYGAPNWWREKNGKLTHLVETEEFRESVAFSKRLWDAGVYHPNSPAMKGNEATDLFNTGKAIVVFKGNQGWAINQRNGKAVDPKLVVGALPQFGADGGPGQNNMGSGSFGYTVITSGAKDRVEEILGILNFLAGPFGSEEYHLVNFGIEGVHHTVGANGPALTDLGKAEVIQSYHYMASPEQVLFDAQFVEEYVKPMHAWETELVPNLVASPTTGLTSDTESRVNASLLTMINDTVTSVTVGRKPMSALDALEAAWLAGGGSQIKAEYEKALAKA